MKLAIDFDETLATGNPPVLRPGASDALRAMKKAGQHLILYSARLTPDGAAPFLDDEAARFWQYGEVPARTRYQWELVDQMRGLLKAEGLWELFDEAWTSPGKPLADAFIDDLTVEPNWALLRAQYGG